MKKTDDPEENTDEKSDSEEKTDKNDSKKSVDK